MDHPTSPTSFFPWNDVGNLNDKIWSNFRIRFPPKFESFKNWWAMEASKVVDIVGWGAERLGWPIPHIFPPPVGIVPWLPPKTVRKSKVKAKFKTMLRTMKKETLKTMKKDPRGSGARLGHSQAIVHRLYSCIQMFFLSPTKWVCLYLFCTQHVLIKSPIACNLINFFLAVLGGGLPEVWSPPWNGAV